MSIVDALTVDGMNVSSYCDMGAAAQTVTASFASHFESWLSAMTAVGGLVITAQQ